MKKGAEYFRQAIEKDPAFAPAHAGLADMCASAGFWGFAPPAEACGKQKSSRASRWKSRRRGRRTPRWDGPSSLYDYDYAAAEKEFQRAIALYPDYAFAHMWYGHCLTSMGRLEEALAENRRALQLDPLCPISHMCYEAVIWLLRDWDRCIDTVPQGS